MQSFEFASYVQNNFISRDVLRLGPETKNVLLVIQGTKILGILLEDRVQDVEYFSWRNDQTRYRDTQETWKFKPFYIEIIPFSPLAFKLPLQFCLSM